MKRIVIGIWILTVMSTVAGYTRECKIDNPYAQKNPPFKGKEYTYWVQLRSDEQTLTPSNTQGAVTKTCYVQLDDKDRQELAALVSGYTTDFELRNIIDRLDPKLMQAQVIQDLIAQFNYQGVGTPPTVQNLLDLIKPD